MSFWSAETLSVRLSTIVAPFAEVQIDCSAYELKMGAEFYVSPASAKRDAMRSIRTLVDNESFALPPGQFAFLLTEERLLVPSDAFALISIKAELKLRGLVNVSGFHVDPGYSGRLIFGVINAGPETIHIRRGDRCFLIWFANLDHPTKLGRTKPGFENIPSGLVSNISGQFKTVSGLSNRIDSLEVQLRTVIAIVLVIVSVFLALLSKVISPGAGVASETPHFQPIVAVSAPALPPSPEPKNT